MEVERRARERAPARYRPRRPNQSVLYRTVQEHLETWLAHCRDGRHDDKPLPERHKDLQCSPRSPPRTS